jgi:hypothetical protein
MSMSPGSTVTEAPKLSDTPTRRQFFYQSAFAMAFLSSQAALAAEPASMEPGSTLVADAAELIKDEKEVIDEIGLEESKERQATEDTSKLISELEVQILKEEKESDDDTSKASSADKASIESTKNLIDNLEKEEENLETETKELISKLETLEKAEDLPEASPFLNKLKERVGKEEDLIARLKRESESDMDPKTGKFKAMTGKDFKARAPSDFDFLQYLKESVTNNQEFERDLDAFKGLLEKGYKPVLELERKAETQFGPLVESAVEQVRKAVH